MNLNDLPTPAYTKSKLASMGKFCINWYKLNALLYFIKWIKAANINIVSILLLVMPYTLVLIVRISNIAPKNAETLIGIFQSHYWIGLCLIRIIVVQSKESVKMNLMTLHPLWNQFADNQKTLK